MAVMFFCVCGVLGEFIGEWNQWNKGGNSNTQHLIIWAGFFLSGLIEYCHINNILLDHFWCILPPIGMSFIAIMLMLHDQVREYWRFMHMFSGFITVPLVLALIQLSINRLNNTVKASKGAMNRLRPSSLSFKNKSLEDLNPIYTELSCYDTVLPGFVSFLIFLQSITWYEMAFRMGWYWSGDNLPPEVPHAHHAFLAQVIGDMFLVAAIMAFISLSCRIYDRSISPSGSTEVDNDQQERNSFM